MNLLLAAVAAAGVVTADHGRGLEFVVQNESYDAAVYEFYLVRQDGEGSGRNLVQGEAIFPGETLRLTGILPGSYNVRLVDEFGGSCAFRRIDPAKDPTFTFLGDSCFSQ